MADRGIILHQFSPCPGDVLSGSPFCAKVEVFCRLFDIPFEVSNGLRTHVKTKKCPWIEMKGTSGETIDIADSNEIIEVLASEFGVKSSLSTADTVTAHLLTRTLDEHMYWTTVRTRWTSAKSVPFLAENYLGGSSHVFASFVVWVSGMRNTLWAQGTGRFTEDEVVARIEADCAAITALLNERSRGRFLFNSVTPNPIDATLFSHLSALLKEWDGNWALTPRTATGPILSYLSDMREHLKI